MHRIALNASGTRSLEVSDKHLATIDQFNLFQDLIDSHGYIDETVLEKLRLTVRGLILSQCADSDKLFDLCVDVLYHEKMKSYGLHQLILLYIDWKSNTNAPTH